MTLLNKSYLPLVRHSGPARVTFRLYAGFHSGSAARRMPGGLCPSG